MDEYAPGVSDLFAQSEIADAGRALPIRCRRPYVVVAGSAAACSCVQAVIGEDYHIIPVLDGKRVLPLLRSMRHLLLIVVDDGLASVGAPELFARLAGEPELARRHSFVYLTSGARRFDLEFAWHLELLHVNVVHIPTPHSDLLDSVTCAARHARLRALGGMAIRDSYIGAP